MTAYVDPQHVEVIAEAAKEQVRFGCSCGAAPLVIEPGPRFEQCFAHMVLGLLQPTVTAHEVPW